VCHVWWVRCQLAYMKKGRKDNPTWDGFFHTTNYRTPVTELRRLIVSSQLFFTSSERR
jgi:hypothetical protein